MTIRTIIKKTLAIAALTASLVGISAGVAAGTASAKPIQHTAGGNCGASGGQWESFWAAGSYIGGTCTYNNNYRANFDSNGINYMDEKRVKGKWVPAD